MAVFPLPSVDSEYSVDNKSAFQTNSSPPSNASKDGEEERQPRLCDVWRDIQGANNWKGLLNPMSPILKAEALRYGDLAQLCYDAFDGQIYSKYYGTCKHSKQALFEKMDMAECGYQVTKYIYANTDLLSSLFGERTKGKAVWIGFIAVCNDPKEIRRLGRRDIVIAWRGTQTPAEWIQDLRDFLVPARLSHATRGTSKTHPQRISTVNQNDSVRMERGFLNCYTATIREDKDSAGAPVPISARHLVMEEIKRLLKLYEDEMESLSITLTGHSLGAALATLNAYDIKQMLNTRNDCGNHIPVTVFSFASPRVGNLAFAKHMEDLGVKVMRFVNKDDAVPKVPGVFMNENMGWLSKFLSFLPWTYFHVGVEVCLHNNSPFLEDTHNLAYFHNLEVYLHLVDGFVGEEQPFQSAGRDPALVNKSCDLLKEKLEIRPEWWQQQNKGLVKGPDGKWKQPTRSSVEEEDLKI